MAIDRRAGTNTVGDVWQDFDSDCQATTKQLELDMRSVSPHSSDSGESGKREEWSSVHDSQRDEMDNNTNTQHECVEHTINAKTMSPQSSTQQPLLTLSSEHP